MGDTPNLHLALAGDADEIRNWQILDAAILALGLRQVIPGNVLIQGDLEITGATTLDGTLSVAGQSSLALLNVSQAATFLGTTNLNGPLVVPTGPITLPPGSIDGAALLPGTGIFLAAIGTAQTAQQTVGTTPGQMATLLMDPSEDPNRWELVIIQATLRFALAADNPSVFCNATLTMRRGGAAGVDQQSRVISQNLSRTTYLDIPITMIRLTKPPMLDEKRWSLTAFADAGLVSVKCVFAQVYCLQFR